MKKRFFGSNIEAACEYCTNGSKTNDQKMVLCCKKGLVAPYYSCRKFSYDPIKRVPKCKNNLPKYKKEDFEI